MSTANKILMGAAGAAGGGPSDDEFNRVSFLSHFDGENNGVNNVFDDGSASNHTITANGNVTQGSFGPFARPDGEWGVDFDGGGTHHCAADADFAFGTGDFCMEAWVFVDADDYNFSRVLSFGPVYGTGDSHGITVDHTDYSHKTRYYDSSSNFFLYSSAATPRNIWFHVAVTKASNTVRLFINGTVEDSGTNTNPPEDSSTNTVAIGNARPAEVGTGADFQGFISNARVVKGSAVYTSDFTPPTAPLTAITNTKLLTCQSNRFVDNSAEAHAILINGTAGAVQVSAFGPFLTSSVYDPAVNGASLATPAAGDYFSFGNIGLDGHSGDFSIEAWIYPTSYSLYSNTIYGQGGSGATNNLLEISLNSSGQPHAFINQGSVTLQSTFVCPLNSWTFVQLKRTSGTLDIFINGVQSSTVSNTATIGSPNRGFVGTQSYDAGVSTRSFFGFICDVRVSVVTRSVSLPTAPLAVIDSNTKLLLNMADGQAIDSTAQNNLTLAGNAKISTGQAKFGNTSMVFDGTGDYAKTIFKTSFGTGNFTIEYFFRVGSVSTNQNLFQFGGSFLPNDDGGPGLGIRTSRWRLYTGANTATHHSSAGPSNNTWYHIAVVRNGTTTKLYVDGVETISVSDSYDYSPRKYLLLGGGFDGSYDMNGYMDEFRISHMARYTSNFTAPTEPFADKGQDA